MVPVRKYYYCNKKTQKLNVWTYTWVTTPSFRSKRQENTSAKINWPWFLIMCPIFSHIFHYFPFGFSGFPLKKSPIHGLRPGPAAWLPRRMAFVVIRYKGRAPQPAGRLWGILGWYLAFWASKWDLNISEPSKNGIWTIKPWGFEPSNGVEHRFNGWRTTKKMTHIIL